MARPKDSSPFDMAQAKARVIEGLSDGIPLAQICREQGMPAPRTIADWKAADEQFAADFARARETGFDVIADDVLRIVDEAPWQSEAIQKAKMQAEYRLKLLAKWSKRYSDKQTHSIGGDPDAPAVQVEHGVDAATLAALSDAILAKPQGK